MFVIGIIAFNQFRNEQRLVQIKGDLSAGDAHFDVPLVGQKSLQFGDSLGWNDNVRFLAARNFQLDVHHRQPPSIRRDHGHFVVL